MRTIAPAVALIASWSAAFAAPFAPALLAAGDGPMLVVYPPWVDRSAAATGLVEAGYRIGAVRRGAVLAMPSGPAADAARLRAAGGIVISVDAAPGCRQSPPAASV